MTSVSMDPSEASPNLDAASEFDASHKIVVTLLVALAVHLFLILGISFEMPKPAPKIAAETIDIIVVNHNRPETGRSDEQESATQNTIDDTDTASPQASEALVDPQAEDPTPLHAPSEELKEWEGLEETPTQLPEPPQVAAQEPEPPLDTEQPLVVAAAPTVEQPEAIEAPPPEPVAPPADPPKPRKITAAQILASRDLEIADLSSRIRSRSNAFGSDSRRKAINSSTRDYKYSNYLDAWRKKVERIGNLNYPQEAKRKGLFGNLILHVALRSDGSIETLRILRSSGEPLLDEAAMNIVRLAAPYSPFPEDIKSETDILDITRTWQFLRGNRFSW